MELSDLRYFLAVAREESIKIASENLYISQPGLSKVIKRLENELGKELFIRENRKITLTEDGILLRKRAQEIIDLVDKTKNEFSIDEKDVSGEVLIGAGESEGMKLITNTIKIVQEKFPNVHFQVISGNAELITEKLDKGLLDFGVLIGAEDITKYDYITLPIKDTWGILMRDDSLVAKKDFITLDDLVNLPLIFPNQINGNSHVENWFQHKSKDLNIVAKYNLIFNAALMVEDGVGYALCLDKLVNLTSSTNLIFKPLKPSLTSDIVLIWKKYQVFSESSRKFLEDLKQYIQK